MTLNVNKLVCRQFHVCYDQTAEAIIMRWDFRYDVALYQFTSAVCILSLTTKLSSSIISDEPVWEVELMSRIGYICSKVLQLLGPVTTLWQILSATHKCADDGILACGRRSAEYFWSRRLTVDISAQKSESIHLLSPAVTGTMTTLGSRNFAVAGAKVWNSLPVDLRLLSRSLRTFGHKLKHYLFMSEPWAHLRFFKVALYKFSHYYYYYYYCQSAKHTAWGRRWTMLVSMKLVT